MTVTVDAEHNLGFDEKDPIEHIDLSDSPDSVNNIDIDRIEDAVDLAEASYQANERDHKMDFWEACKVHRGALFWSLAMSFTIVMDGYVSSLMRGFYGYPSFTKKYGVWAPSVKLYSIEAKWQILINQVGFGGNLFGTLIMGFVTERLGHRLVVQIGLVMLVGINFMFFFATSIKMLAIAQAIQGIPTGMFGTMGSVYAAEVAPLPLRGFLTSFIQMCWVIGGMFGAGVLAKMVDYTSDWSYRIPMAITWAWPIPIFIIAFLAPDAPAWLIRKRKFDKAEKSLKRLSPKFTPEQVRQRLASIIHNDKLEKSMHTNTTVWDCFKGTNLRRTEIACMTLTTQVLSGETFTAGGGGFFLIMGGMPPSVAYKIGLGATGVSFVFTIVSWLLNGRFGRRSLILSGWFMCIPTLLCIGIADYFRRPHYMAPLWGQAALALLWDAIYCCTIGTQSFGLVAEVPASRVRAQTISVARFFYQGVLFGAASVGPVFINPTALDLRGKTAFVWFGTSCLGLIWCYFRMPETKDISYTELDLLFEHRVPARKFKTTKVDVAEEIQG